MLIGVQRPVFESWIERYERLWHTPGTAGLAELFTVDATYQPSPWAEPVRGLDALAAFWDAERDSPDEGFTLASEVIAVEGEVGVVRVEATYDDGEHWRDLWVIRLDGDGRCAAFEEWPFSSTQTDGH